MRWTVSLLDVERPERGRFKMNQSPAQLVFSMSFSLFSWKESWQRQRPQWETKSCSMARFPVQPSYVRCQNWLAGLQALVAGPLAWLAGFRSVWLGQPRWLASHDGNVQTENFSMLQYLVPCRDRWPKKKAKNCLVTENERSDNG